MTTAHVPFGTTQIIIDPALPLKVVALSASSTQAAFLAAVADMTVDEIRLASGSYTWQAVDISMDRTARPLTIRPALGATVNFVGPATTDGSIFDLGGTGYAKWITFDGRDPNGTPGMIFRDFALASSGVFQPWGTDHCSFKYLTFQNLARDPRFAPHPYNAWCFYIAGPYGRGNTNLLIDHCWFKAPAVSRDIGCMQVASSGSHGLITVTNVLELTNYNFAFYAEQPCQLALDTWTMVNSGNPGPNKSIDLIGAVAISGSITNIAGTGGCSPYSDTHSGGGVVTISGLSIA